MNVVYHNNNNMDSELLDTLNILRPPVRREHKIEQDYIIISKSDGKLFRELSQLYKLEDQKNSKHSQPSSLSLILEKTCKKQIIQKYSLVSSDTYVQKEQINEHISNFQNKPTIKVTVIPKKDKKSIIKYLDSQNQTNKINKKENGNAKGDFFATKNVYLLVAGRKEEKIYEIKTTASSKKFRNKARDVKKLKLNDTKRIVMNMEKKRKKTFDETDHEKDMKIDDICKCDCGKDPFMRETGVGSSKVKIFGRIGLNQNDKYVMKCAATVNGQPVATDFFRQEKIPSSSSGLHANKSAKILNASAESQATQADIEIYKTRHPTFDQNIQCNSSDFFRETLNSHKTVNIDNGNLGNYTETNTLKRSNSPLVIISVYPKHEVNNFTVNKPNKNTSPTRANNNRVSRNNVKEPAKGNNLKNKSDSRNTRERSPYKINQTRRPREVNRTEDLKGKNSRGNKTSRSSSPSSKSTKIIKESKKGSDSYTVKSRSQSPNRIPGKEQKGNQFKEIQKITNNVEVNKTRYTNMKSKSKFHDRNTKTQNANVIDSAVEKNAKNPNNTKKNNGKAKVMINNDNMDYNYVLKKSYPKSNISKVSVNIDSEKECYDVIFEKGKYNTDLIVRKTMKDIGSQKYFEEPFERDYENDNNFDHYHKSDSLENFFLLDVIGQHRRSVSQAFNNQTDDFQLTEHMSRLNVRDSLEIGHRREEVKDLKRHSSKNRTKYDSNNDNDGDFSAPLKHFPGDDCAIPDPIERDKRIRELLGIDNKRTVNKFDETQFAFKPEGYRNDNSVRKTFSESLVTCLLLRKCSCSSCFNIKMTTRDETNNFNVTNNKKQNNTRNVNIQNTMQLNETIPSSLKSQTMNTINDYTKFPIVVMQSIQSQSKSQDIKIVDKNEANMNEKSIQLSKRQYRKVKKSLHILSERRQREKKLRSKSFASVGVGTMKSKHENVLIHFDKNVQTDPPEESIKYIPPEKPIEDTKDDTKSYHDRTVVLFSRGKKSDKSTRKSKNENVKKVASSVEIRFTGFEGITEVACSHSDIEAFGVSKRKKYDSLETIFRGKKRARTPNLGASVLSLLTEEVKQVRESPPPDLKPKKPFLKRLMSCLVMRYAASEVKLPKRKEPVPTLNSSIDSYHINTSVGALEMSSSLYDTSASFYSNYTIGPINKAKRGFFCSVREFLAPKKS